MSRTLRPTPAYRAGLAGLAVVAVLTACGGNGEDSSAGGDPAPSTAARSADGGDFCSQAAGIDQRVDTALSGLDDGDASLVDGFRQIAVELRGITPPSAIASDWAAMAAGLDRMADAFADFDLGDLGALDRAEGDLTAASNRVEDYLSDECGI
jgi:hypothetical protein